jgi:hypothetical protein
MGWRDILAAFARHDTGVASQLISRRDRCRSLPFSLTIKRRTHWERKRSRRSAQGNQTIGFNLVALAPTVPPRHLSDELKRHGHPPQSGCPIRKREEIVVIGGHHLACVVLTLGLIGIREAFSHNGRGRGDNQGNGEHDLLHRYLLGLIVDLGFSAAKFAVRTRDNWTSSPVFPIALG